ncbi:MAG: response regulator [Rhodospirillaceae bacterium]|nr:response regulator [Rhodospirillaceae bacterium]
MKAARRRKAKCVVSHIGRSESARVRGLGRRLFRPRQAAGAGVVSLETGEPEDLPELIHTERPRLVLLHLVLPATDGIGLMEQVPELTDLPVRFISAFGRDETIAWPFQRGAAHHIVKPFSPTDLIAGGLPSLTCF